ncbi:large ribosomal subunit protein uL23m isoform X2 [Lagenorhynchus albirostris]|uniref:large ribosomal subunit protein uL23m isoform X2 n=1 Tax=Lagenorhynchus albirostris TaxID=27610 RepID=UPI0028E3CDDE|nr:large ribosomal subunit protein uL23m isoform X2 [Lagenorhynchus albirostris]
MASKAFVLKWGLHGGPSCRRDTASPCPMLKSERFRGWLELPCELKLPMTRVDLRSYLERIYNVPVAAVRTRVQHGSNRRRDYRNVRIKKPDYKVAHVQLAHGQTFTFPDLFPEKKRAEGSSVTEDLQDQVLEDQRRRQSCDPRLGGVPGWFGL